VWWVVSEAAISHCVRRGSSQSCIEGLRSEVSGCTRQKKLKEGEACSGFPRGGGSLLRSAGALSGCKRGHNVASCQTKEFVELY
jgi:hypothetical protein